MAIDELIPNDKTGFAYDLTNSELSDFYRKMLRIRRFEEASANLCPSVATPLSPPCPSSNNKPLR